MSRTLACAAGLALLALPFAAAGECEGRGCICPGIQWNRALTKNEQTVTCMMINGQKAVFYPRVDEFAVLEITGLDARYSNTSELWLTVEGHDTVGQNERNTWMSHNKQFTNGNLEFPFFTAIARMTKGVIDRVQWSSGCFTCSSANTDVCVADGSSVKCDPKREAPQDACFDCSIPKSQCLQTGQCVPRVYLAWIGTDARGTPCTSAGKVISRYRSSSLRGLYDSSTSSAVVLTPLNGLPISMSGGSCAGANCTTSFTSNSTSTTTTNKTTTTNSTTAKTSA